MLTASSCTCVYTAIGGDYFINEIIINYTRLKIPFEEAKLQQKLDEITGVTNDTLLMREGDGLYMLNMNSEYGRRRYRSCILGYEEFIFGSTLPYAEIISRYDAKLREMGFQTNDTSHYRDQEEALRIAISEGYEREASPTEWATFPTLYTFSYFYISPPVSRCSTPD